MQNLRAHASAGTACPRAYTTVARCTRASGLTPACCKHPDTAREALHEHDTRQFTAKLWSILGGETDEQLAMATLFAADQPDVVWTNEQGTPIP